MLRGRELRVYAHEQPGPRVYEKVVARARAWTRARKIPKTTHDGPFAPVADFSLGFSFYIRVDEAARRELDVLVASFGPKAKVHLAAESRPDDEDYRTADYVALWGRDLPTSSFANAEDALVFARPCRCGRVERIQVADLEVQRSRLEKWDIVNGLWLDQRIVSPRVAKLLGRFEGPVFRPVRDAKTKRPLPMVQVSAKTSIRAACKKHDRSGVTRCVRCGAAKVRGAMRDHPRVAPASTKGHDLVSEGGDGCLYASRRLYDALAKLAPRGLAPPSSLFLLCPHPERKRPR